MKSDESKVPGFRINNIGHVGGDIVGGDKVTAEKIQQVSNAKDVHIQEDDTPRSIQGVIAVTGLIGAIVALLSAIAAVWFG